MRIVPGREHKPIPTGVFDESGNPLWVEAGEVQRFFTDEFWDYYEIFAMTEILGVPPYSGGWAEWPSHIAQALFVIKAERQKIETEESKRRDH